MNTALFEVGAALFGACIGSFLNVVVWRLPQQDPAQRRLGGRSRCPACGETIRWHDNLPVLGWILRRGRARCCGASISARYPFVEALTAGLFLLLAMWPPFGPVFDPDGTVRVAGAVAIGAHAVFVSLLVALTFIDFDTQLLPDVLTKPGIVLGLVAGAWPGLAGAVPVDGDLPLVLRSLSASVLGFAVGGGITWGVRILGEAMFKKQAMGFGDVKLMAMIGAFLGYENALLTLFLGCVLGSVVGVVVALRHGMGQRIPFGPYLAIGAVLSLFVGDRMLHVLLVEWPEWQRQNPSSIGLVLGVAVVSLLGMLWLVRRGRRS